ncbi:arylsulfotransferase family protein [SAR116 cluster bacterium]|nr:arylsulfotransferase family protein [SAR116 cluster bacterium]
MSWFERIIFKKIPLWFFLLVSLFLLGGILFATYATYKLDRIHNKLPFIAFAIEKTVITIDPFLKATYQLITNGFINPQIINVNFPTGFSSFNDDAKQGYFLVSAYDVDKSVSSVFLYDLKTQNLLYEWSPNINNLLNKVSNQYMPIGDVDQPQNFRAQHPIMTDDGGVVFSSGEGLLVKLDKNSNIEWHIERHFHHSIEPGLEKDTFISQIIVDNPPILPNGKKIIHLRNDGYVIFSGKGKIIEERSLAQILIDNGYIGLLFGTIWQEDRIHLNDAEYIKETDGFVQRGDIMMSARNISTVLLYRPSENRIVWLKTGPFLNQHDIDYIGEGKFSIFGNDNVEGSEFTDKRLVQEYSSIYIYDMLTDNVLKKLELKSARISINSQGRLDVLENGNYFIDDGQRALILDSKGNIIISYSHKAGEGLIGAMHWTRFIPNL